MQKFHCILLLSQERSRQLQASELVLFGDKGLPRDRYVCTGNSIHTHNARETSPFCTALDGIHSQSQPGDGMLTRDCKWHPMNRSLVVKFFSVFSKLESASRRCHTTTTGDSGPPRSVCIAIFKGRGPFRRTFPLRSKSFEQVHWRVSGERLSLTWRDELSLSCFYAWSERHTWPTFRKSS